MTFGPSGSDGAFLAPEVDFPQDPKLFREILTLRERATSSIMNTKESGSYEKSEILAGQQWFSQVQGGAIKTTYIYRFTFDLVEMNGGPLGAFTSLALGTTATPTIPARINIVNAIFPVRGFGAASDGTNFYFINDPAVYVRTNVWTNATQQINITNNTGNTLTYAVWCFEYYKT